ncbi:MAG: hypothetical protein HYR96_14625 [Deltaproteobacteria bacterium]|nr:hypothetical protein [Deltaproteobacteria bacterium]MBI3294847.1 hypothetical protein [Deltaproteobacteria bacterium]
MKQIAILCLAFALPTQCSAFIHGASFLEHQTFMDLKTAEKRFGQSSFSPDAFKSGDAKSRAKMSVSLIRAKKFVGKAAASVRKALGD